VSCRTYASIQAQQNASWRHQINEFLKVLGCCQLCLRTGTAVTTATTHQLLLLLLSLRPLQTLLVPFCERSTDERFEEKLNRTFAQLCVMCLNSYFSNSPWQRWHEPDSIHATAETLVPILMPMLVTAQHQIHSHEALWHVCCAREAERV
jgi:hypothetical protein